MIPVERMRTHCYELATACGARLVETTIQPHEAVAVPMVRMALVHPIIDETTYAVALHELGHIASALGHIDRAAIGDRMMAHRIEEHAAWQWAQQHALFWTDVMNNLRQLCEDSYANAAPAATATPKVAPPKQEINWNDWK